MKRLVRSVLAWWGFLLALCVLMSVSGLARAQGTQLEPPPAVTYWQVPPERRAVVISGPTRGCAAWFYRPPEDRFAGWMRGVAAVDLGLLATAKVQAIADALDGQAAGPLIAARTHRLDSPQLVDVQAPCRAVTAPPGPWLVAGGSGSRAGTRVVYALAGDSGSPKLGAALPDRATVGDKVSCADPARRFVASTGSVYCWHAATGGLTLSREVP